MTTIATVLFGRNGRGANAITARVNGLSLDHQALAGLSATGRQLVAQQIATTATGLLNPDLGQLVIGAWRTHSALRRAARATLDAPGTQQVVELAHHRISSVHRPYVDLLADGVVVLRVGFELALELTVVALAAVVSQGRLTALQSGRSELTVVLSVAGTELVRRSQRIDLRATVPLDPAGTPVLTGHERGTLYTSGQYPTVG